MDSLLKLCHMPAIYFYWRKMVKEKGVHIVIREIPSIQVFGLFVFVTLALSRDRVRGEKEGFGLGRKPKPARERISP